MDIIADANRIIINKGKRLKLTCHQLAMAVGFDIPLYGNVWDAIFKYGNNLWYIDVSMYDRETWWWTANQIQTDRVTTPFVWHNLRSNCFSRFSYSNKRKHCLFVIGPISMNIYSKSSSNCSREELKEHRKRHRKQCVLSEA